eukprot:scaffold327285_cov111-Tisochrysis_lutea.AAC.3
MRVLGKLNPECVFSRFPSSTAPRESSPASISGVSASVRWPDVCCISSRMVDRSVTEDGATPTAGATKGSRRKRRSGTNASSCSGTCAIAPR